MTTRAQSDDHGRSLPAPRLALRLHLILIPAAALLAILPLLLHGPSCGHDFNFHLLNWLEARTQLAHGTWPRWAYTPAYNAGEPRFVFYPPLSWLTGALLSSLLPFRFVPVAYTWICLTLSGVAMHRFASHHVAPAAALVASIVYLANPYMLFTAYERTAYAELLAAAAMPLLFAAILAPRPRVAPLAAAVALLWVTNAPAAVMGCYALALLTLLRLVFGPHEQRLRLAAAGTSGTMLGLALSAFYLVPAAWERRFVQVNMALVEGLAPGDNFLFHRMADPAHNDVVRSVSLVACGLLAVTAGLLAWCWKQRSPSPAAATAGRGTKDHGLLASLSVLTALVAAMLFPFSAWLWTHLPELAFLQFPWRLLLLLATSGCLALALALHDLSLRRGLIACAVTAPLLILPAWNSFHQHCAVEDAPGSRAAVYLGALGSDPTDEYTPIGADNDVLRPKSPPLWLAPVPAHPGEAAAEDAAPPAAAPGPLTAHMKLHLAAPAYVILNRRQFPLWRIRVNGAPATPVDPERDDGLITLALPAGDDSIDLTLARTLDETLGLAVSLAALLVWLFLALWRPQTRSGLSPQPAPPLHSSGDENPF